MFRNCQQRGVVAERASTARFVEWNTQEIDQLRPILTFGVVLEKSEDSTGRGRLAPGSDDVVLREGGLSGEQRHRADGDCSSYVHIDSLRPGWLWFRSACFRARRPPSLALRLALLYGLPAGEQLA